MRMILPQPSLSFVTMQGVYNSAQFAYQLPSCSVVCIMFMKADIQPQLNRRRPGQSIITTSRAESDTCVEDAVVTALFENRARHSSCCGARV